jgi:hypothetical protein
VAVDLESVIHEVPDKKTGGMKLRVKNRTVPKELYDVAKVFFG